MLYITPLGIAATLAAELPADTRIIEIDPGKPLLPQLLLVQDNEEVMVTPDPRWTEQDKRLYALKIKEALLSLAVTRHTMAAFHGLWEENAFWNYDAAMSSAPVSDMPRIKDECVIVGGGPSSIGWRPQRDQFTIAASSAVKQLAFVPDCVCQCDARMTRHKIVGAPIVVFTPYCAAEFVRQYRHSAQFVYLDRGSPASARFAVKRDIPEHEPIIGTVADMMVSVALYAGYKKISFIGLDLSLPTPRKLKRYKACSTVIAEPNYHGDTVYTDPVLQIYRQAIEEQVRRHPDVAFYNLTGTGLVIHGAPAPRRLIPQHSFFSRLRAAGLILTRLIPRLRFQSWETHDNDSFTAKKD